ncbi:MAG TPA: PIN domain-containing protein [Anaerolineae bacterium]
MRVLFDTNIILDLFLDRAPFADEAAKLWQANADGRVEGYVSAITPVNLFFIARRLRDRSTAFQAVAEVLAVMSICPVDQMALESALTLPFSDYEDAVQHASAISSGIDAIVTRNTKDFTGATVSVFVPADLLSRLPPPSANSDD